MYMTVVILFGAMTLALFYFGAGLLGKGRALGALIFIGIWFVACLINAAFGVRAGVPVANEVAGFMAMFGVPAAAAWYLYVTTPKTSG
jgi:hypothetical protein